MTRSGWRILAGVALVLSLILGGPVASYFVGQAQTRAAIRREKLSRCESGNDFRAADLARWQYILRLAPEQPDATDAQKRSRARFVAFILKADKHIDCSGL